VAPPENAALVVSSGRLGEEMCPAAVCSGVEMANEAARRPLTQETFHMAEFIFLYRNSDADAREYMGTPEAAQSSMKVWMAWLGDLEAKGHVKSRGEPLERTGKVVTGPKKQVTDGPFAEAKDIVSGFSIIEAKDEAHAIELARGCPVLRGTGSVEVRPVMKMS
jgi:hypothetical protein